MVGFTDAELARLFHASTDTELRSAVLREMNIRREARACEEMINALT